MKRKPFAYGVMINIVVGSLLTGVVFSALRTQGPMSDIFILKMAETIALIQAIVLTLIFSSRNDRGKSAIIAGIWTHTIFNMVSTYLFAASI